jgi:hypothetical protein
MAAMELNVSTYASKTVVATFVLLGNDDRRNWFASYSPVRT